MNLTAILMPAAEFVTGAARWVRRESSYARWAVVLILLAILIEVLS